MIFFMDIGLLNNTIHCVIIYISKTFTYYITIWYTIWYMQRGDISNTINNNYNNIWYYLDIIKINFE